jgi:nucleoside-diphosphate-sugar epimerase
MLTFPSTGASGYIGGDVLHALKSTHPEHQYCVLLRDSAKADIVSRAYPDIRVILGDLDNAPLIEEEAAKADVVIRE